MRHVPEHRPTCITQHLKTLVMSHGAVETERFLHLYIFDKAPRCLPPYLDLARRSDDFFVRALRRAALLPWRDARFWRRAADAVAEREKMAGRDLAQADHERKEGR